MILTPMTPDFPEEGRGECHPSVRLDGVPSELHHNRGNGEVSVVGVSSWSQYRQTSTLSLSFQSTYQKNSVFSYKKKTKQLIDNNVLLKKIN